MARAAMGLLPRSGVAGSIRLGNLDLLALTEHAWREVRWRRISLSFQSTSALNPVLRVGQQAKMVQLLKHLQVERGIAMIFISHDLAVVLRVADRVLVLARGRIVEQGSGGRVLASPQHEVTRSLLSAAGRDLPFDGEMGAGRPGPVRLPGRPA